MCNRVAIIKEGSVIRIEEIATLQKDNYKKIRITASDIDERRYEIDGVSNFAKENGVVSFLFKGDINVMAKLIAEREISDVTIEEPTLEEIFMHYYE
jgi:ABC-2 type transport system ATP-binding protein